MGPWSSSGTSNRHTNRERKRWSTHWISKQRVDDATRNWNKSGDSPAHSKVQTEIILAYHERVNKYYWRARKRERVKGCVFSPDGAAAAHRARTTPDGRAHYNAAEAKYIRICAHSGEWTHLALFFFRARATRVETIALEVHCDVCLRPACMVFSIHAHVWCMIRRTAGCQREGIYIYLFVSRQDPHCSAWVHAGDSQNSLISSPFAKAGCHCWYQIFCCWAILMQDLLHLPLSWSAVSFSLCFQFGTNVESIYPC